MFDHTRSAKSAFDDLSPTAAHVFVTVVLVISSNLLATQHPILNVFETLNTRGGRVRTGTNGANFRYFDLDENFKIKCLTCGLFPACKLPPTGL